MYELGDPVPSLKMEHLDPDNIMRVIYQKTMVLNPPSHIGFAECRECRKNNANGYFNPTFALWQGKVISAWGDPKTGVIQLAWYDPQGALTAANISSGSTGVAVSGEGRKGIISEQLLSLGPEQRSGVKGGYLGIGPDTLHPHLAKEVSKFKM